MHTRVARSASATALSQVRQLCDRAPGCRTRPHGTQHRQKERAMDKRPFEKLGWGVLLTVVLAGLGVTPADASEDGKNYPGSMWVRWGGGTPSYSFSSIENLIANELVPVDVAPVLDWHAMSVGHAAVQDPVNSIRRPGEPYGSDEFSDATVVVRWSQLAQDNAF